MLDAYPAGHEFQVKTHEEGDTEPAALLVPLGHAAQAEVAFAKVPTGHDEEVYMQEVAPAMLYCPGGHETHKLLETNWPAGQEI